MKIAVCLNIIPDFNEDVAVVDNQISLEKQKFRVESFDLLAYYTALDFKRKYGAHVTIVSLFENNSKYENCLRRISSCGADRTVWLKKYGDSISSVSRVFGKYFSVNKFDIIMTGAYSEKYMSSALPTLISGYSSMPVVLYSENIIKNDEKIIIKRKQPNHQLSKVETSMPCIISVSNAEEEFYPPIYERFINDKKEIHFIENICSPDVQIYESNRNIYRSEDLIKISSSSESRKQKAQRIVDLTDEHGVLLK